MRKVRTLLHMEVCVQQTKKEGVIMATIDVPVGAVIAYVGSRDQVGKLSSEGWLLCDGRVLDKNDFPELFNAIGIAFGGDGAPNFNAPDLRGMFLRGVSGDSNRDPEAGSRTAQAKQGNTGNNVGTVQQDQLKNHKHTWNGNFGNIGDDGSSLRIQLADNNTGNLGNLDTTNTDGGGLETRPINVYVFYLIKAIMAK